MGKRENVVETHLSDKVKVIGGITRKWVSPRHDGVPDQLVFLPSGYVHAVVLVEVKTVDGELSGPQWREHKRLSPFVPLCTVYGEHGVNTLLEDIIYCRTIKEVYA